VIATPSTVEHRPADLVAQPLIVQNQLAYRIRELLALPTALESSGALGLACGGRRTRSLDRVGRGTELVCGDMCHRRGLAGSECCVTSCSAQHPGRSHRMAARRAGLGHRDLASRPCPDLLDRLARPRVRRLHRLEEVQNVLRARGRPQSEEPMVRVGERSPAADGDEPGIAVLGKDHRSNVRRCRTIPHADWGTYRAMPLSSSTRSGSGEQISGSAMPDAIRRPRSARIRYAAARSTRASGWSMTCT
jgi:hypothetical protein